uniref:Uncharacterized protein n=1 Tax=Vitis vinifera TaxID=29760 RepID=A5BRW0_VITVI|nr:hypothetical protein VITISV_020707 [Vitis vinifera]
MNTRNYHARMSISIYIENNQSGSGVPDQQTATRYHKMGKCSKDEEKGGTLAGENSGCETSGGGGTSRDRIPSVGHPEKMEWRRRRIPGVRHPDGMAAEKDSGSETPGEATLRIQAPSKTPPKVTQRSMSKMSNGRTTLEYGQERAQRRLLYVDLE